MKQYSEVIANRYGEAPRPPGKFAVKFCLECDRAWQLFKENSTHKGNLAYLPHFKGKFSDKEVCPECENKSCI